MFSSILVVGLGGILLVQTGYSQIRPKKVNDTAKTSLSEHRVHIDFLCAGPRESIFSDESGRGIWLTLKNNSRRTILVRTYRRPKTEHPCARKIRSEVGIFYEVVEKETYGSDEKELKELPIGYSRAGVYIILELKPHSSIVFSVAREHLTPKRAIYMTFRYADDKRVRRQPKEGGERYKAYFYAFELPDTVKEPT